MKKLTPEQEREVRRTRAGLCARCGEPFARHPGDDGKCPDGEGTFSFAFTHDDTARILDYLARVLEEAKKPRAPLPSDAQKVLDSLVERLMSTGEMSTINQLCSQLGWPPYRVRSALGELGRRGLVGKGQRAPS